MQRLTDLTPVIHHLDYYGETIGLGQAHLVRSLVEANVLLYHWARVVNSSLEGRRNKKPECVLDWKGSRI